MLVMYNITEVIIMHRTQIYFEETMFETIKQKAGALNISVSSYIRDVIQKELDTELDNKAPIDFSEFAGLWENRDVDQKSLRDKAWK